MTRDQSFDDEAGPGEDADTAYRLATGISRVARAGAYVTGGALIAANGSPDRTGDAHDSRNVGWAQPDDPEPDAPSPVITFPELDPESVPPLLGGIEPVAEQLGTDAGLFPTDFGQHGVPGYGHNPTADWDPSATLRQPTGFDPSAGLGQSAYDPSAGIGQPPSAFDPATGPGRPAEAFDPSAGLQRPAGFDPSAGLGQPDGDHGFGMPGIDEPQQLWNQFGQGLKLPGTEGLNLPGMNGGGFGPVNSGNGVDSGVFDGIGENFGVVVTTDTGFSMHVGLDGVWVDSHMNIEIGVGDVGDQLDRFNQSVEDALSDPSKINPAATQGSGAVDQSVGGLSGLRGQGANSPGTGANPVPGTAPSATGPTPVGTPAAPAPVAPAVAPAVAPVSVAPVAPAAPIAPVAPAPVAATPVAPAAPIPVPVAPAPVAPAIVAQPVTATPWQTTIQPDAATKPIANVLAAPEGPSPLTAPAIAAPALLDTTRPTETTTPQQPTATVIAQPTTPTGGASTPTTGPQVSTPNTTDAGGLLTPTPGAPTTLPGRTDTATTELPGVTDGASTTVPGPGGAATTKPGVDGGTTTVPGTDGGTTTAPSADGGTTAPGTDGGSGTPTGNVPTTTPPVPSPGTGIDVAPTQPDDIDTGPTQVPSISAPQPSVDLPDGNTPDLDVPTVAPTPAPDLGTDGGLGTGPGVVTPEPMPQPAPTLVKPSIAPQPAKPIADVQDGGYHAALYGGHDDFAYGSSLAYPGGALSTQLMPEATLAESHHPVSGSHDITLL
ncbi:Uncharacterised protein [Nocardia otitidiscaviarum]|uniref:Uncharacterized protein n=1 Tax=Nocardia otitidiscaviarum TaxID=1823 RepID=A0A378YNI8_9NOCA|nr:hypothetical protein [Nocardia otitidiscaviarum]SUA78722.1 Uncharacterised protein [Nocardia otitidiscaviarum]